MAWRPAIGDPEGDDKIIIQKFMHELCRRDDEDNRGMNTDPKRDLNVFSTQQIRQKGLSGFDLERVTLALRRHLQENRDNEPFEFLDEEKNVKLTNAGRARCDEYGLRENILQ